MGIPRSALQELVGGCCVYGSLAAVVTDDLVDLEDDSFEYWSFDTWLPSYAVLGNTVLDYLLEEIAMKPE